MKVYYICESCQEVFYEGKLGEEEGILTVDALCPDCAEEKPFGRNEIHQSLLLLNRNQMR